MQQKRTPGFGDEARDMGHRDYGYGRYGYTTKSEDYYDNTDHFSPMKEEDEGAKSYIGKGPKGWARSDDRILDEVNEMLNRADDVDASDIETLVTGGVVVLKGTVTDRESKKAAERWVEHLAGVQDVRNELRIKNS